MLAYLVQGVSLGVSAAASPGPFQAYVIAQTLKFLLGLSALVMYGFGIYQLWHGIAG